MAGVSKIGRSIVAKAAEGAARGRAWQAVADPTLAERLEREERERREARADPRQKSLLLPKPDRTRWPYVSNPPDFSPLGERK